MLLSLDADERLDDAMLLRAWCLLGSLDAGVYCLEDAEEVGDFVYWYCFEVSALFR